MEAFPLGCLTRVPPLLTKQLRIGVTPGEGDLLKLVGAAAAALLLSCASGSPLRSAITPRSTATDSTEAALFREQVAAAAVERARALDTEGAQGLSSPVPIQVPRNGDASWWSEAARSPFLGTGMPLESTLGALLGRAVDHSTQIRVFSQIPLIRETGVAEAEGRFTPRLYAEGKYERRNEPVGSTLTTGRSGRFKELRREFEYGVRKRLATGAEASVSHQVRWINNNSIFFVPDPQTTSRLSVTLVQPLLRGAGLRYNRGIRDLATIDTEVAKHEFLRQVESHLVEVHRAYWQLYLSRAVFLQKQQLADENAALVRKLEGRGSLDAGKLALVRARSEAARSEAERTRARIAIENATNRILALVNDPALGEAGRFELIPIDAPSFELLDADLEAVVGEAVNRRPEVAQAFLQYEAAAIRNGMARNESRFTLDLILEVSSSGLDDGTARYTQALSDGAGSGPGYLAGLRFEVPIGPDETRARARRRRIELRQQESQVKTTLNTVVLEAQVSLAEYRSARAELKQRQMSAEAARETFAILDERFASGITGGIGQLEQLLDAQERRAEADERYAMAQVGLSVAVANLRRAQGGFLGFSRFEAVRIQEAGQDPDVRFESAQRDEP